MQMMWKVVSNGLEVDADVIEADVVWRLLFIVLGRWQGFLAAWPLPAATALWTMVARC